MAKVEQAERAEVLEEGHDLERDKSREVPDDVESLLQELGGEVSTVQLWRRDTSGKLAYLEQWPVDQFSLDHVRDLYGGGRYQARFKDHDHQYVRAKDFRIDGPAKYPGRDDDSKDRGDSRESLTMLQVMMQEVLQELRRPRSAGEAEGSDALNLAVKMSEMVESKVANVVEALRANQRDPLGFADMMELVDRGIDLGRRLEGGSETDVIRALGGELISFLRDRKAGPMAGAPAGGGGQAAAAPANVPPWVQLFRQYIPMLTARARAGKSPETIAALIVEDLPDPAADFLERQLARGPAFREEFYQHFPAAANTMWWFDSLMNALEVELSGEAGNGSEPESVGHDMGHEDDDEPEGT